MIKKRKSIWSFFEKARIIALKSNHKYKIGALLVKGGNIINYSCNSAKSHKWAKKIYIYGSRHAELSCLLNMDYNTTNGSNIFVCRTTTTKYFALSRPCNMCIQAAKKMGIKKIFYTINENEYGVLKI